MGFKRSGNISHFNNSKSPRQKKDSISTILDNIGTAWINKTERIEIEELPQDLNGIFPIENIPNSMRRQEYWELEYRKRPYMQEWLDTDVIELWHVGMMLSMLWGMKNSPIKLPQEAITKNLEQTAHLMVEMGERGIAIDRLKPTRETNEIAIQKLPFEKLIKNWLRHKLAHID